MLNRALDWAANFVHITPEERNIILKSKQSFLYIGETPWVKKGNENFDVGMGAWDGAETTDLVGLFLLSKMQNLDADLGLYRDDGLLVTENSPRNIEKLKQKITAIYQAQGLNITIDANRKQVNFLDLTLNLENKILNRTSILETLPSM